MRAVAILLLGGTLISQAGCDAQPVSRSAELSHSAALPLYNAISAAFAPCKDAVEKSKDIEFRVSTTAASKSDGYRAADDQAGICDQVANNILKLGEARLPSDTENASAQATVQACISDALAKSQSGGAFKRRISASERATGGDINTNSTGEPIAGCPEALADFARLAKIGIR